MAAAHLQLVYFTVVYVALVFVLTVTGALNVYSDPTHNPDTD